jgi:hypothetical protein
MKDNIFFDDHERQHLSSTLVKHQPGSTFFVKYEDGMKCVIWTEHFQADGPYDGFHVSTRLLARTKKQVKFMCFSWE